MKRTIKLELDIPDVYIKTWSQNIIQSTHNYDEAINVLKENTFEKALVEDVVEYILNYYGSNFKVDYEILNPDMKTKLK